MGSVGGALLAYLFAFCLTMKNTLCFTFIGHSLTHYIWIILLWSGFLVLVPSARGQYFVPGDAYCPTGPGVTFDTITYSPDKAMPFDRCFVLKVSLSTPQRITKFFVTPINQHGNPKARRRDRRVFIRSGYSAGSRRNKARDSFPFATFKDNIIKREFTGVSPKTKSKQITLLVPPLDPGREYRIFLAGDDDAAADEYLTVGDLIVQSKGQFGATSLTAAESDELLTQAKIEQNRSNTVQNQRYIAFARPDYRSYVSYLTSFNLVFNQSRDRPAIAYRLLFVPPALTLSDATSAELIKYCWELPENVDPDTASITLPVKDINGQEHAPFDNWQATVYLLTLYKAGTVPATPNSDLVKLGELEFKNNGLTRTFTANPNLPGSKYVKLIDSPLGKFNMIKENAGKVKTPPTLPTACTKDSTLRFLLTQAARCPCEEKGIKDLTQKDDLMRTISLFYENNTTVVENLTKGLISLKEPFATPVKPELYALRAANFTASLNQINDLIEFARKEETYHASQASQIKLLLTGLGTLRGDVLEQIKALTQITKSQAELKAGFVNKFDLNRAFPVGMGSTTELNLVSDTRFRIVPDFGFVALFKGNNPSSFQDFTPYLGFQVGFRSMDKNIPLRMIRYKSWRHRLSFMSGVTLKSIKIEGQREDFFKDYSLITGLGFRLNNYLRVST